MVADNGRDPPRLHEGRSNMKSRAAGGWRFLVLIAFFTAAAAGRSRADTFVRGDSNLDGRVDISDAVSILNCQFLGTNCTTCDDAADTNDDGSVDISDAVYLLSYAFLGGNAPPAPFPSLGVDPTDDGHTCRRGLGPEITALEVAPTSLDLEPGASQQLTVTAVYSTGQRVNTTASASGTTYQVDLPAVATVSSEGLVAAVAEGNAVVSVQLETLTTTVPCAVRAPSGVSPIVISELMYHPASDDDLDEYIEITNRGSRQVDLAGWKFVNGVKFTFPAGTLLDPGRYLVIAKDAERTKATYGITNVVGNYDQAMGNNGERIQIADPAGKVMNEVRFHDGGNWPRWADGWGPSLELIDLHGSSDTPEAWAASEDGAKSEWTPFQVTQTCSASSTELQLLLITQGECLIDDLQVLAGGVNRLADGSFENDPSGFRAAGTHRGSEVTAEDASQGTQCLHLVATGLGDTTVNHVGIDTTATINSGQQVTIRGAAKWIRGSTFLMTRLNGDGVQFTHTLKRPARPGSPGAPNSTAVSNRGPDIEEVAHAPVLPGATSKVTITALVHDIDGVASVKVRYRINNGAIQEQAMLDDGTAGDTLAEDAIYTAVLPARAAGTMIAFWIVASDGSATSTFPAGAPTHVCLYRVGEPNPASQLDRYHIWMSPSTIDRLGNGAKMSNELLDITFVRNNTDVFYDARMRLRGSPFIRSCPPLDPVSARLAYRIDFGDKKLDGREELNLDNLEVGRDPTLQREHVAYRLYQELGLPWSGHNFIRLWINGADHQVYADVEKAEQEYLDRHFPGDSDGYLHKVDDRFEFTHDPCPGFQNSDARLVNLGTGKEAYRWNFEKRSHEHFDEYSQLTSLVAKLNTSATGAQYQASVDSAIDAEEWCGVLAIRRIVGDWDSLGYNRGKNMYMYLPLVEQRWKLLPWDIDFCLGDGGDGPGVALFGGIDPAINRMLDDPKYKRMYLQVFRNLVDGPFTNEFLDPIMDQTYALLRAENSSTQSPQGIKDYIRARRSFILSQLPPGSMVITTNGGADFSTSATTVTIDGQAPLEVESFRLNGAAFTPQRSGLASWSFNRPLVLGKNTFLVEGLDGQGELVSGASIAVTRVVPCVPASASPSTVGAVPGVAIRITGTGFVPGTTVKARLTSASEEPGFNALWVYNGNTSFGDVNGASALLNNPASATSTTSSTSPVVNFMTEGGGERFPPTDPFPVSWPTTNFAGRFTGFVQVSSAGLRTFGVHSDDGFRLKIDGQVVAEYPQPRGPGSTLGNFNFPAAGSYPVVLDWYENGGGDIVELFQEDGTGDHLVNGGSEVAVTIDDVKSIPAQTVVVESATSVLATFDLTGADPGVWNVVITPAQGSDCGLQASVTVQP
jgi:CotH protein/lamin tail-like protein/Big-like domain-containing protein/PA14 domain-containing protein